MLQYKLQEHFTNAKIGQTISIRFAKSADGQKSVSMIHDLVKDNLLLCPDELTLEATATHGVETVATFTVSKRVPNVILPDSFANGVINAVINYVDATLTLHLVEGWWRITLDGNLHLARILISHKKDWENGDCKLTNAYLKLDTDKQIALERGRDLANLLQMELILAE